MSRHQDDPFPLNRHGTKSPSLTSNTTSTNLDNNNRSPDPYDLRPVARLPSLRGPHTAVIIMKQYEEGPATGTLLDARISAQDPFFLTQLMLRARCPQFLLHLLPWRSRR